MDEVHALGELLFAALAPGLDHVALALTDGCHIDPDGADLDAELVAAAGEVGDLGAGDHGLRRGAAVVDAGAADRAALDHGDAFAARGEGCGEGITRLAGAQNDDVVVGVFACCRDRSLQVSTIAMRHPTECRLSRMFPCAGTL